jgi:hypothetical protein
MRVVCVGMGIGTVFTTWWMLKQLAKEKNSYNDSLHVLYVDPKVTLRGASGTGFGLHQDHPTAIFNNRIGLYKSIPGFLEWIITNRISLIPLVSKHVDSRYGKEWEKRYAKMLLHAVQPSDIEHLYIPRFFLGKYINDVIWGEIVELKKQLHWCNLSVLESKVVGIESDSKKSYRVKLDFSAPIYTVSWSQDLLGKYIFKKNGIYPNSELTDVDSITISTGLPLSKFNSSISSSGNVITDFYENAGTKKLKSILEKLLLLKKKVRIVVGGTKGGLNEVALFLFHEFYPWLDLLSLIFISPTGTIRRVADIPESSEVEKSDVQYYSPIHLIRFEENEDVRTHHFDLATSEGLINALEAEFECIREQGLPTELVWEMSLAEIFNTRLQKLRTIKSAKCLMSEYEKYLYDANPLDKKGYTKVKDLTSWTFPEAHNALQELLKRGSLLQGSVTRITKQEDLTISIRKCNGILETIATDIFVSVAGGIPFGELLKSDPLTSSLAKIDGVRIAPDCSGFVIDENRSITKGIMSPFTYDWRNPGRNLPQTCLIVNHAQTIADEIRRNIKRKPSLFSYRSYKKSTEEIIYTRSVSEYTNSSIESLLIAETDIFFVTISIGHFTALPYFLICFKDSSKRRSFFELTNKEKEERDWLTNVLAKASLQVCTQKILNKSESPEKFEGDTNEIYIPLLFEHESRNSALNSISSCIEIPHLHLLFVPSHSSLFGEKVLEFHNTSVAELGETDQFFSPKEILSSCQRDNIISIVKFRLQRIIETASGEMFPEPELQLQSDCLIKSDSLNSSVRLVESSLFDNCFHIPERFLLPYNWSRNFWDYLTSMTKIHDEVILGMRLYDLFQHGIIINCFDIVELYNELIEHHEKARREVAADLGRCFRKMVTTDLQEQLLNNVFIKIGSQFGREYAAMRWGGITGFDWRIEGNQGYFFIRSTIAMLPEIMKKIISLDDAKRYNFYSYFSDAWKLR